MKAKIRLTYELDTAELEDEFPELSRHAKTTIACRLRRHCFRGARIWTEGTNAYRNHWTVLHNSYAHKLSGRYIIRLDAPSYENGRHVVSLGLNEEGARRLSELSSSHPEGELAAVLDGAIREQGSLPPPGADRILLRGNYAREELRQIITMLIAGSLPVSPRPISEDHGAIR